MYQRTKVDQLGLGHDRLMQGKNKKKQVRSNPILTGLVGSVGKWWRFREWTKDGYVGWISD